MTRTESNLPETWEPFMYKPSADRVWLNMGIYSIPGVGKTTLGASASTVEAMAPVCILNAESGMEALTEDIYDADGERVVDRSNVQVIDCPDFGELAKVYEWLAFGKHGFKSLVVDTLDEIHERSISKWDRYYIPTSAEGLPLDRGDDKKMGLKVYHRSTREMTELIRKFRDLQMHIIFVCHETDRPMSNEGPLRIRMDLTPALYSFVEGALSIIGRLSYKELAREGQEPETHRILQFRSATDQLRVKDRTPNQKMGKLMVDPTMARIWARRTGEGQEA